MKLSYLFMCAFALAWPSMAQAGDPPASKKPRAPVASAPKSAEFTRLQIEEERDGRTVLRLHGNSEVSFNVYRLENPRRVVVDIADVKAGELARHMKVGNWLVNDIAFDHSRRGQRDALRLTVTLERDASYIVVPHGNQLVVTLTPRDEPSPEYLQSRGMLDAKQAGSSSAASGAKSNANDPSAKIRERAAARLRQAESMLERAAKDLTAARAAKREANAQLARVRKANKGKPGQAKGELERAKAQRDEAAARAKRLAAHLAKAKGEHAKLQTLIAREAETREALAAGVLEKSQRIERLEAQIAEFERRLAATKSRPSSDDLQRAKDDVARASAARFALEQETQRLRETEAKNQAEIAKLRKRMRATERGKGRAQIGQRLESELAQLEQVQSNLDARNEKLNEVTARLKSGREVLEELSAAHRAVRMRHGKTLARQRKAKADLARAKGSLAKLENSIESERQRLAKVQSQVARSEAKLGASIERERERLAKLEAQVERTEAVLAQRKRQLGATTAQAQAGASSPAMAVSDLRFETTSSGQRLVVMLPGDAKWNRRALTPTTIQLSLDGVAIASSFQRRRDLTSYGGPIESVTSFQDGRSTRIIVATREGSRSRIERSEQGLVWNFDFEKGAAAADRSPAVSRVKAPQVGGFVGKTPSMAVSSRARRSRSKWRGDRIDIELQDAPIKDVLLLFSDIGRVNIIAGTGVEGVVSMKLASVPWDQALDIILRSLSLGMVQEGNVIRVATISVLEEERAKAIERANAQVQLKPLDTRLIPLSYATVEEMIVKVQSVLSPRGTVTPDSRTNTLIIMDVADNIALAEQLISQLDSQTPQVLIEARIVEARTSWLRQLGIQWGFDYRATAGTGNPTGLIFPNSFGVGGGSSSSESNTNGLILGHATANPNYAVDLPAPAGPGSGGAIGFSFGSIAGNLNTNLRLSAAEDEGEVRLISAPKVVTMDNTQAEIEQGVQIPISQVSAEGVNTRYVNATLALRVTPHVTNEGSVVLDVDVQKNEADFINTGARGDPTILTKQARSRMLITDGDTAVIGGIYTRNQSTNRKKVPWVAEIPIIGWFFKNKSEVDTRTELLIFLTPKIINRSSSIGG